MAASEGFFARIKRAAKWHWNLLFLGAGVAFAFLSGQPDVILPALLAAELGYLGFVGTNERFQNVLRGQKMLEEREKAEAAARNSDRLGTLFQFLAPADRDRFENTRERSRAMTELQKSMRSERSPSGDAGFKTQSLDKLLWLFLRLLHHKAGLERFLDHTSEPELREELANTEAQLAKARERDSSHRLISSLEDKLTTIGERLANYETGAENLEVLAAELDKTEQKINHICEVGMTSRDGSELSHQIDGVADSVRISERALADLDLGDIFEEDAPPVLTNDDASLLEME